MKFSNVNSKVRNFEQQDNSNLMKVEIMIQHDGLNRNNSFFKLDNIKRAEDTLRNIPILGYIKKENDSKDFDQHNMETKLVETDDGYKLQIDYLESPVGVIPSDTEITYEEINGRTYLICYGYIWSNYCKDAASIINTSDNKKVSMEISVDNYSISEDGYMEIEDYKFLGLTILGDSVESGMIDTVMTKYSSRPDYKKCLEDIYKEIYSIRKEDDVMENMETVVGTEEVQVEEIVEITPEVEVVETEIVEEVTEEVEVEPVVETVESFALSTENISVSINSILMNRKVETEDYWGDKYTTREFYLYTILPQESIAVVEDNVNYYSYYGVPYEIKGDDVVLDFDAKVPYMQEWRAKKENESVEVFTKEDELKDVVLNKFNTLKEDMDKLKEFKAKADLEELKANVEEVSSKFSLDTDITDLKEKAINSEISLEQFEEKIGYLFALEVVENQKKFSAKQDEPVKVKVQNHDDESKKKPYGGILD